MRTYPWVLIVLMLAFTGCTKKEETPASSAPLTSLTSPQSAAEPAVSSQENKSMSQVDLSTDEKGLSKAVVVIETNKGTIKYKFYSKDAPHHVARQVQLIGEGFYNGIIFHRVEPNFVIQTGDPTGTGRSGSKLGNLKAEFNKQKHLEGTVAMARTPDPDSANSQFYICLKAVPFLDNQYSVFGQVIEGMDVVQKIQVGDKMTKVSIQ